MYCASQLRLMQDMPRDLAVRRQADVLCMRSLRQCAYVCTAQACATLGMLFHTLASLIVETNTFEPVWCRRPVCHALLR